MANPSNSAAPSDTAPGELIRALRKKAGFTLSDLSSRTGLALSTLSRLEKGHVSLSYDKLMLVSKGLGVDMAQLLEPNAPAASSAVNRGRRTIQRGGEGRMVETATYKHMYLATELLSKRFTPMIGEVKARSIEEFFAEFGDYIRHPGEEFLYVLEGELEFHTELYAPTLLKAGDSIYFDSEMGHAYLKVSEKRCRSLVLCCPRGSGGDKEMLDRFLGLSKQLVSKERAETAPAKSSRARSKVAAR